MRFQTFFEVTYYITWHHLGPSSSADSACVEAVTAGPWAAGIVWLAHRQRDRGWCAELSFVFCMTDGPSSMCVAGAQPFHYMGKGSGWMFMSRMFHASGAASEGTMKVAFFFRVVRE